MKRILWLAFNAKFSHTSLTVRYLRQAAAKLNIESDILELTINNYVPDILSEIYEHKPDIIGISCYIWNISLVRQLACDLAMVLPDALLFAGGPEVSWNSREFLQENPAFQGVLRGEGEASFKELVLRLFRDGLKAELSGIPGLCFRDEADADGTGTANVT